MKTMTSYILQCLENDLLKDLKLIKKNVLKIIQIILLWTWIANDASSFTVLGSDLFDWLVSIILEWFELS